MFRFGSIPDMLELDHLTVSGDVTFGRGVSVRVSGTFIPDVMLYSLYYSRYFNPMHWHNIIMVDCGDRNVIFNDKIMSM